MAERRLQGRGGFGRPGRLLGVLVLACVGSACYGYTTTSPAAAPPGSSVRLRVEPRAPLKVGEVPLPDGGRTIRGKVLPGSSPDTLLCSVALPGSDPAAPSRGLRGTVLVPVAEVDRLEVRHLLKGRTAAVVGAGAVLGVVVLNWAFDVANPNTVSDDGGGGPNNALIPLFSFRW